MPMTGQARNSGMLSWRRAATCFSMLAVLTGCPKRFDPRAETVRQSPDPDADHEYHEAKARLDIGDAREAEVRFADFLRKHPGDPLAPSARIGQARAELLLNQPKKAKEILEPVAVPQDDPTAARARYLLGLALHKTGDWSRSRQLLRPFADNIASSDDSVELHAILADDAVHLGDWQDALVEYSAFFGGARPAEKLYLKDRVSELCAKLPPPEALRLWSALPHDSLAAAYLGKRVAADRSAAGDAAGAAAILDQSKGARERAGLEGPEGPRAVVKQGGRIIGVVLPLSGRQRAYGERALRGALLAADLMAPPNLPSGPPVELCGPRHRIRSGARGRGGRRAGQAGRGRDRRLARSRRGAVGGAARRAAGHPVPRAGAGRRASRCRRVQAGAPVGGAGARAGAAGRPPRRALGGGAGARFGVWPGDGDGVRRRGAPAQHARRRRPSVPRDGDHLHRPGAATAAELARCDLRAGGGVAAPAHRAAAGVVGRDAAAGRQAQGQAGAALRHRRRAQRPLRAVDRQVPRRRDPGAGLLPRHRRSTRRRVRSPATAPPTTRSRRAWTRWRSTPCARCASPSTTRTAPRPRWSTRCRTWARTGSTGEIAFTAGGDRAGAPPLYTVDGASGTVGAFK